MMTAADLQHLSARTTSATGTKYVNVLWSEWQAVLDQARFAVALTEQNERLQQSLALHEGPHVTMTVEYAAEIRETALRLARLADLTP